MPCQDRTRRVRCRRVVVGAQRHLIVVLVDLDPDVTARTRREHVDHAIIERPQHSGVDADRLVGASSSCDHDKDCDHAPNRAQHRPSAGPVMPLTPVASNPFPRHLDRPLTSSCIGRQQTIRFIGGARCPPTAERFRILQQQSVAVCQDHGEACKRNDGDGASCATDGKILHLSEWNGPYPPRRLDQKTTVVQIHSSPHVADRTDHDSDATTSEDCAERSNDTLVFRAGLGWRIDRQRRE